MKEGADGENRVAYIEGNRDHPVNQGVLCAKGSAGIMQVNAPSRLRKPLKRVGARGEGKFEEISWEEALGQSDFCFLTESAGYLPGTLRCIDVGACVCQRS